jgi:hypothetical protein
MKIRTMLGIGAALCATAVFGPPRADVSADEAGNVKLIGSAKDVNKLIKDDAAELQKALSDSKPKPKDRKRAQLLAVVIALNAKALGAEGAGIQAQATKIAEALAKGDDGMATAKKEAAKLLSAKADGAAGDAIKTLKDEDGSWDRDLAMQLFKTARAGGLGIEGKVKSWSEKAPASKEMETAAAYAQKCAVVGMILDQMSPPKDKKVSAADWKKYADDMTAASADAMKAAKNGDGKAVASAFSRVDRACTVCHEAAR